LLYSSSIASAQTARRSTAADPDMQELASYTLTMDTMNRIDRAMRAMAVNIQKDPKYAERIKLKKELDALKKKDETTEAEDKRMEQIEARLEQLDAADDGKDGDTNTLSDMERKIGNMPVMANALKQEGVTPREFAKFSMAMLQGAMTLAGQQMSAKAGKPFKMPEGVNPANVKFVQEHEAEIKKMQDSYTQFQGIR
jgi:hypothetical protein